MTLAWGAIPRGEVALVIAGMGFSNHLIGSDIMSVAVMAMVGSILITSWRLPRAIAKARAHDPHIFDSVSGGDGSAPYAH
jgi:Kef-type K+ transport system membrane component KefB